MSSTVILGTGDATQSGVLSASVTTRFLCPLLEKQLFQRLKLSHKEMLSKIHRAVSGDCFVGNTSYTKESRLFPDVCYSLGLRQHLGDMFPGHRSQWATYSNTVEVWVRLAWKPPHSDICTGRLYFWVDSFPPETLKAEVRYVVALIANHAMSISLSLLLPWDM